MLVTKQLTVAIDFHSMKNILCKASVNSLVTNIFHNIVRVQQKKETHTVLEKLEGY